MKGINTILSKECIERLDTRSTVPATKVWLMLKALRTHGAVEEVGIFFASSDVTNQFL